MPEKQIVSVFRQQLDDAAAKIDRKLYYPYYSFKADCTVSTLLGKKSVSVTCLVDALNGVGATAERLSADRLKVGADSILQVDVAPDEAVRTARRMLMHQLSRRLRMISDFGIELESLGLAYKCFWVARSSDMTLMIDSVTGCTHPLRTRAA
ncbi:MAG: hypothetical protein ACE5KS_08385 [Woeseiaceae bacterium]